MINIIRKKEQKNDYTLLLDSLKTGLSILPSGYTKLSECPEVIMAVNKIADLISNMTLMLMQNTDKGDIRVKNGLSKKLDIDPCFNMTRKQWIFFIVRTLLLDGDGNAVVKPVYSSDPNQNYLENLIPIPAGQFSINLKSHVEDGYTIQINNKKYKPDDLIHFVLNPSPENPFKGNSYRIPLKKLINTLDKAEDVKQEFMSGSYMPRVVIKVDTNSREIENSEGKQRILDKYIKSENAGEPWVIPSGLVDVSEIKPLSLKDIAVTDAVAQDKKTIASLLGVPSFFLGEGTFNRDEYNTFIQEKILSIAKIIEQTLTQKILVSDEYYFKFNLRSLYSYDLDKLATVGGLLFDKGIMTGNEIRDWIGLSPKEGLDDLKILENYIPIEDSGNQKKLNNSQTEEVNNGQTD